MSSSTIKIVQRVNIQRARDKQILIEKYGRRGKLIKLTQKRSKLSTQIDGTLNHHVERYKFNGPAEIFKSNDTITEDLRIKLSKLSQSKEVKKTAAMRAHHLTNYLSNYIINMFQSGYIGSELNDKYPMFQISRVLLDADLGKLEIYWLTVIDEKSNEDIEKNYLSRLSGQIRHDIISNRFIGYMPPVLCIRDNSKMILDQLEELLKVPKNERNLNKNEIINKPVKDTPIVNNVNGVDHNKLMKQIISEATKNEVIEEEEKEKVDLIKKKYDLTLKAMKINQKIKKEKIYNSALLRLTITEFDNSRRMNEQNNHDYDDDDFE